MGFPERSDFSLHLNKLNFANCLDNDTPVCVEWVWQDVGDAENYTKPSQTTPAASSQGRPPHSPQASRGDNIKPAFSTRFPCQLSSRMSCLKHSVDISSGPVVIACLLMCGCGLIPSYFCFLTPNNSITYLIATWLSYILILQVSCYLSSSVFF
jgi:hypothetical protein